jgi:hypothetical protein
VGFGHRAVTNVHLYIPYNTSSAMHIYSEPSVVMSIGDLEYSADEKGNHAHTSSNYKVVPLE